MKGIKIITKPDGRRYVYKRTPGGLVALPDLPENDPRFLKAYAEADRPRHRNAQAGSIAALCEAYLRSPDYAALGASTRAVWRRIVDKIGEERGAGMVEDLRTDHLRKDVRAFTPGAAKMRLKVWRSLLRFAVDDGWRMDDPSRDVKPPKSIVKPHRQWTRDEIDAYRAFWPMGSAQRTAFEVIYWTAARCVDARLLGWQMVTDGWLSFVQVKTGNPVTLPVTEPLPSWASSFRDDLRMFLQSLPTDGLQWIVSRTGAPRTQKGLSQWLSKSASDAGLASDCTAHGLRKARAAAISEIGGTPHMIGAWIGDVSLSMAAHYTREANRKAILLGPEQEQNSGNRMAKVSKMPRKPLIDKA